MNLRQSIEKAIEPMLREVMAAAKTLGLPTRDRRQTRKAAASECDLMFQDCDDVDPLDTYRGKDKSFERLRCLYAIAYLLDPLNELYPNNADHPIAWMKELQDFYDLLRTALPRARREPSDRVALARHEKLKCTQEQIGKLEREMKQLKASRARAAA
ncbi:MAG: hypothetical protein ACYDC3_10250 [Candidatus Binataceae bacterium]